MLCQTKPAKTPTRKSTSIDPAFALSQRANPMQELTWTSPITAGPYLVPVTRWVE